MSDLNGRTVFITGASRGIGAAAVQEFAEQGANVSLFARDQRAMQNIAASLGEQAFIHAGDIANPEDIKSAILKTHKHFGRLDILINNAATLFPISHQKNADLTEWSRLIDVNVKGIFYANHTALPLMLAQGGGSIFTIGSGAAHSALEGWSAYCTSKAAAFMLNTCTDLEYREKGIRSISLSPGTVATQMQKEIKKSGLNPVSELEWSDHIPASWPAKALVWMCGPEADAYLGQEIRLKDPSILKALGLS